MYNSYLLTNNIISNHLLFVVHHSIFDGLSNDIFLSEFDGFMNSKINNNTYNIKPLLFQYIDYSMFEEKLMISEEMTSSLEWWINQFDNSYVTKLTLDRPRLSTRTGYGKNIISKLSNDISSSVFKWI